MARKLGDGHISPLDKQWSKDNLIDQLTTLRRAVAQLSQVNWSGSTGGGDVTLGTSADTLLGISGQQLSLDTQTANRVLAGPASGAAAVPTFRTLVANDMTSDAAEDGQVLTADGYGGVGWLAVSGDVDALADLSDVDATAPSIGDVLTWDGDSWGPDTGGVGAHDILSALHTDTDSADTPADGDVLVRRSDQWVAEAGVDIASDDADISAINAAEQGSDPSAPGTGRRLIYPKSDGWYDQDDAGVVTKVGISDHGALSGRDDDDHSQYLNETRHDLLDHAGLSGVGAKELLVQDGSSAPPVTLTNEAEDDWLYAN